MTIFVLIEYYFEYRYPGQQFPLIVLVLEWSRVGIALAWNFIAFYHYELNGIRRMRRWLFTGIAGFSLGIMIAIPVLYFFRPSLFPLIHVAVILLLYHAGIRALFILKGGKRLLPSSRTALTVAIISLVIYPAIGIGDPLGWRIPFLNPGMSLWVQGHPVYFIIINIPITVFIIKFLKDIRERSSLSGENERELEGVLSLREREVLELLLSGWSNKHIAERLFISLPTVKTHIQHIYQKLEVKRRSELFARFGKRGVAE